MVINQFLAYCHNSIQTDLIFVKVHEPPPLYDGWGFLSLYLENRTQVPVFFLYRSRLHKPLGCNKPRCATGPHRQKPPSRDAGSGESGMNTRCQELLYKTPLLLQSRSAAVILYGDCRRQCALKTAVATPNSRNHRLRLFVLFGGRYRTRTCDLLHVKQMLYQLS